MNGVAQSPQAADRRVGMHLKRKRIGFPFGGVRAVAQEIRNNVRRATGLTCSIGVTPNKLLAKIASDLDKPDGLTLLDFADIPERIWPLPVRKINGIGPKATERLAAMGLRTIGELAASPAHARNSAPGRASTTTSGPNASWRTRRMARAPSPSPRRSPT